MAEQAILTVSLKDYKKQIDDLRASLLNLESTSEEYKNIAEEIRERQDKLNEVMGVGKKEVDAVAGSYNALSKEMSALKKEWKTLEIGSERWVELGAQIDGINNKLKEADASVGVFGRNVGNYQQAFEGALKSTLGQVGKLSPQLSQITGTIGQLVPIIKNVTKAATSGLKGIKAAITATGIGALITALGVLLSLVVNNKDAIIDWATGLDKAKKEHKELTKAIDDTKKSAENYITVLKTLGASEFKQQSVQLNALKGGYRALKQEYDLYIATHSKNSKYAKELWSGVTEAMSAVTNQQNAMQVSVDAFIEKQKQLKNHDGMTAIEITLEGINREFDDAIENAVQLKKDAGATAAELQALRAELEQYRKEALERAKTEEGKKRWQEEARTISSLTQTITDSFKSREQLLKEQYNKELKLLKKHHKDTTDLERAYQRDIAALQRETLENINTAFNNLSSANSGFTRESLKQNLDYATERLKEFAKLVGSREDIMPPDAPLQNTINLLDSGITKIAYDTGLIKSDNVTEFAIAWQIAGANVKAAETALKNYSGVYNELENAINNYEPYDSIKEPAAKLKAEIKTIEYTIQGFNNDTLKLTDEIGKNSIAGILNRHKALKKLIGNLDARLKEINSLIDTTKGEEREAFEAERKTLIEERKLLNDEFNDIDAGITRIFKLKRKLEKELKELNAELAEMEVGSKQRLYNNAAEDANTNKDISGFWNTTNFNDAFQKRIDAERFALSAINQLHFESEAAREDYEREHQQRLLEIQQEYTQARIKNYNDLASGINSILGSIGDMYEQDIENQVNAGKKSKAEAEKEYKKVQNIKVATATIDTIQGAIAAFMGYQEIGQPWGAILGAIQAAAVTAAGIAQIQKIKSTNPYSNSTPDASSFAAATPTLRDYTPEYFTNITGANDTQALANALTEKPIRAYVVEDDINAAQQLSEEREKETTF